jgi:hypothetical protein
MRSINPPPLTIVKPGEGLAVDPSPGSVGVAFNFGEPTPAAQCP